MRIGLFAALCYTPSFRTTIFFRHQPLYVSSAFLEQLGGGYLMRGCAFLRDLSTSQDEMRNSSAIKCKNGGVIRRWILDLFLNRTRRH
jgi:hypothetical protein